LQALADRYRARPQPSAPLVRVSEPTHGTYCLAADTSVTEPLTLSVKAGNPTSGPEFAGIPCGQ